MRLLILLFFPVLLVAQPFSPREAAAWKDQANRITIIRDSWGIPHIFGKTDADAVFGLLYAQCEDDFASVEANYVTALGRSAEVNGEDHLYSDLVARLLGDSLVAIERYRDSPGELKLLLDAFAGGANYYLITHPETKPALIKRFKPWMPLLFSEGSIGGDKSAVSLSRLRAFYSGEDASGDAEPDIDRLGSQGSNAFAIAPSRTTAKRGILLINPHTTFYFRSEVHAISEEGLNAYGAVTWGQFFIYQGFNPYCGWMHTTARADAIDEYRETIVRRNDSIFYEYDGRLLPVRTRRIAINYRSGNEMKEKIFDAYFTHHGPIVGEENGKWVSFKMLDAPVEALTQSFMRTKAKGLEDFQRWMELRTNTSNGTTMVDRDGNIAYWHGNFVPKRNPAFDYSRPVDGSDPETEWNGAHDVKEIVQIINPASGWIQNCNSTPFTGAGPSSPPREKYPAYMAPDNENARAINAIRLLSAEKAFTPEKVIAAAYDTYLGSFDVLLPPLFTALQNSGDAGLKQKLAEPVKLLERWDRRSAVSSEATTLAIAWAGRLRELARGSDQHVAEQTSDEQKLRALETAMADLEKDFGTWKVKWGDMNRYQRPARGEAFDDAKPSLPVGLASGAFGSLPSYASRKFPGTIKRYGTTGNSFVCIVEFGDRVRAKSIVTGGQSSDPASKHFSDQAEWFLTGKFKDVLFYKEDIEKHVGRKYTPGK